MRGISVAYISKLVRWQFESYGAGKDSRLVRSQPNQVGPITFETNNIIAALHLQKSQRLSFGYKMNSCIAIKKAKVWRNE